MTSPEFNDPARFGDKVRTPLELVLATRRALGAHPDTLGEIVDALIELEQPPFGHPAPNGWPETGDEWMNAGSIIRRLSFADNVAGNGFTMLNTDTWPRFETLARAPFGDQVDGALSALLRGRSTTRLRDALITSLASARTADGELTLRRLIALTIGSAEFQRR